MSFGEWFIFWWGVFILTLAVASSLYGSWSAKKTQRKQDDLDQKMEKADEWCRQHVRNTANFHRADCYYHEFE